MRRNIGATEIRLPHGSLEFPACAAIAHQGDTKIPPLIHKGKIIFIWRNAKSTVFRLERFELSNLGCGFRLGHFFTLRHPRPACLARPCRASPCLSSPRPAVPAIPRRA